MPTFRRGPPLSKHIHIMSKWIKSGLQWTNENNNNKCVYMQNMIINFIWKLTIALNSMQYCGLNTWKMPNMHHKCDLNDETDEWNWKFIACIESSKYKTNWMSKISRQPKRNFKWRKTKWIQCYRQTVQLNSNTRKYMNKKL